ncbi:Hypothetical Protein FCC1311_064382 [Hondaea fermentalgiana]|uniref:ABC transporter TMD0 domain-containing protein n=1 Tax=Hondaea fermentalgiana TaxID=2315210 RepID=A0A2R5GKG3_9STRA|nr:Hypothetical Protein FCC1311_064382 [Hondaea fermentalgiana]|eukprot:GBG30218.1 Hypothetical Protein FCC1311_064382 [Hondaea fermentalgiana]
MSFEAGNASLAPLNASLADADGGLEAVNTVHGWCDGLTGWGPTTRGDALTMCFCSSVIELPSAFLFLTYALPRLYRVMREPEVKPAASWRYQLKFVLTLVALACAIVLAIDDDPPSPAVRISMSLTSLGWLVSLALLVAGYHRHLPSFTCLRLWWVGQFTITIVIFLMHAELHTSDIVHFVRGAYAFICVLLGIASLRPSDQPLYQSVDFSTSLSRVNSDDSYDVGAAEAMGVRALDRSVSETSLSDETPLLDSYAEQYDSIEAGNVPATIHESSAASPPMGPFSRPLERQISNNLLMTGASTSRYNRVFAAFNDALYGTRVRNEERKSPEHGHVRVPRGSSEPDRTRDSNRESGLSSSLGANPKW